MNMSKHRIPTEDNPLHSKYIQPIAHYISDLGSEPLFYQDFIYCCPFNKFLLEHFEQHMHSNTLDNTWQNLFRFFSRTYSGAELANLVYEVLYNLGLADSYLTFLKDNHYNYMWPNGEDFCDAALECPDN